MFPSLCSRPVLFVPTWDDKDNNLSVNLDQDKNIISSPGNFISRKPTFQLASEALLELSHFQEYL